MNQGLLYYTCLTHNPVIEQMCRENILSIKGDRELVSVSRGAPISFGENLVVYGERSSLTMHQQVLAGLQHMHSDAVFLIENDVLYHPSHFHITPPQDTFCYNTNVWKVRYPDGLAVWTDNLQQTSGLCARRETLLYYYAMRVAQITKEGSNRHYEPGLKQSVGSRHVKNWLSMYPNLDIRHGGNLTKSKWKPSDFRNPQYAQGWREAHRVEGWGDISELFKEKV